MNTMNTIDTQRARIQALQARIKELESTSTVPALEREIAWLEGVVYNPSYNATDIRLLLVNTPRELRMGLTTEFPEQKTYLPAQAEKAYTSEKTASKRLRTLADTGMFSYRYEVDPETKKTHVHLGPLPPLENAPIISIERAKEGGSTWENGKRVKRCKDCDSPNLVKVITSQIICGDCGVPQSEPLTSRKQVNPPDAYLNEEEDHRHSDTRPTEEEDSRCHSDTRPLEEQQEEPITHHRHSDTDATTVTVTPMPAPVEIPQLPPLTVNTLGVDGQLRSLPLETEEMEPPAELRELSIWVCWRYEEDDKGKPTKVPYIAASSRWPQKAKSNDSTTWRTYSQAKALAEQSKREGWKLPYDGVGWMCNGEFTGVDLDHCRNKETGEINQEAQAIIAQFASCTYVTPSDEGIRIIVKGSIPRGVKRPTIELYCERRFFTWGKHLVGTPTTIANRQEQLTALHAEITPPVLQETVHVPHCAFSSCSDEELLDKARNARNGAKFRSLWEGNTDGYPSQSEADQALCYLLAYWSGNDASVIDRLFRQSGLYREKWDRAARSGETYGEGTIRRALEQKEQVA